MPAIGTKAPDFSLPDQKEQRRPLPGPGSAVPPAPIPAALVKERQWADSVPEDEPAPYEETYRDGSAKNECW